MPFKRSSKSSDHHRRFSNFPSLKDDDDSRPQQQHHHQGLGITSHLFSSRKPSKEFGHGRKVSPGSLTPLAPDMPISPATSTPSPDSSQPGSTGSSLYYLPRSPAPSGSPMTSNTPPDTSPITPTATNNDNNDNTSGGGDTTPRIKANYNWGTSASTPRMDSIYESDAASIRSDVLPQTRPLRRKSDASISPLTKLQHQRITPSMISGPINATLISPSETTLQPNHPMLSGRPIYPSGSQSQIQTSTLSTSSSATSLRHPSVATSSQTSFPSPASSLPPQAHRPSIPPSSQPVASQSSPALSRAQSYQRMPIARIHSSGTVSAPTTPRGVHSSAFPSTSAISIGSNTTGSSTTATATAATATSNPVAGSTAAAPSSGSSSGAPSVFTTKPVTGSVSSASTDQSSYRKASTISSSNQSQPARHTNYTRSLTELQRMNRDHWDRFVRFVSHSRQSDSLVYAKTRKEAWLHSTLLMKDPDILELWLMMALRFLLKNQLLFSPEGRDRIAKQVKADAAPCVLDIQGVMKDFWAWQLALDQPDAMVYGFKLDPTQTSYSSIPNNEGPPNYIPFVGHSLARLPFDDNFFDVVSAKTLWYLLKRNQWDFVFRELYRVLKPGGVIELVMSDFTLLNRCPIDRYLFERFEYCVNQKEMDMRPSMTIAGRLAKSGFKDISRALIALPRNWGNQIGSLTDLLSSYYMDSLVKHFSDYVPEEVNAIKMRSILAADMGFREAGIIVLFCATKPEN